MPDANWLQQVGLTPLKGTVVAILTLVLIVVCITQFPGGNTKVSIQRAHAGRTKQSPSKSSPTLDVSPHPKTRPMDASSAEPADSWPELPLDVIVQYDPFQLPRRIAAKIHAEAAKQQQETQHPETIGDQQSEQAARRAQVLTQLQQEGVELIIAGRDRVVALIGSQTVQVGDTIAGFRVTEIRADGVVLAEEQLP